MNSKQLHIEALIRELMYLHAPLGWTWKWDSEMRRWGQCNYLTNTLSFSKPLLVHHDAREAHHTILHEIAHARAGRGHGHNATWKAECKKLGIEPSRYHPTPSTLRAGFRWAGKCPRGHEMFRMRRTNRPQSCARCSTRFNQDYLIRWAAII